MKLMFLVEEDPAGGFTARALGESIFTEADTPEELIEAVRDAVRCHYERDEDRPKILRLHYVCDVVVALCGHRATSPALIWRRCSRDSDMS